MGRVVVDGTNTIYEGDGTGKLELDAVKCFHLVELHFDDSNLHNLYLTDNFQDISFDSATAPDSGANTYSAVGGFLSFGPVSETTELRVNTINITLSGVDNTNTNTGIITDVLSFPITNKRVVIYRSFGVDSTTDQTKTFMIFDGTVKNFNVVEGADEAQISVAVSSHWANFEQKNGRITNTTTQANTTKYNSTSTFTGDKGFEYSSALIADIQWGPGN
jgi:hypothetical protein|tara:strand:+ start:2117 stop:2773 length:657 start_codon:yes stop_codon:yes gene_type:complete